MVQTENRPVDRPTHHITSRRDNNKMMRWVMGAIGVLAILGVITWSMSGDDASITASNSANNNGSVTRTAPNTPATTSPAQQ